MQEKLQIVREALQSDDSVPITWAALVAALDVELTHLPAVHELITQLLDETLAMQMSTRTLSQQLEARAHEVAILTEQLERVQTEALLDPSPD